MTDIQQAINTISKILRKHHFTYDQTKYVFAQARKAADIKPPKTRTAGTVKRMSKEEKDRFLNAAFEHSPKIGLMMMCLYETGARVDEFCNLVPADLYMQERKIIIQAGKGNKRREIPITEHLVRALSVHLDGRTKGYIFETTQYKRYSTRRIQQIVKDIAEASSIAMNVTPHTLRHTRATLLAEGGMSKDHLQIFLGHSKPETTQIYTHTAALDLRRGFDEVENKKKP